MLTLLPALLAAAASTGAVQEEAGTILHEPESGATLTLPAGWSFAKGGDGGFVAFSEDERGFILLASTEKPFEEAREDVKALILGRLDDVTVAKTTVVGMDERGSLEAMIAANGKGISKRDGEEVEFSALFLKSGDTCALALGAWKSPEHAEAVATILAGLHVKKSAAKGGLEMTDATTGASITFPEGWDVVASRKGILAVDPERGGMIVVLRWQGDFEKSLEETREALLTWVFKDVTLGEFAVAEASYDKSLGRVVAASGKAIDRIDAQPVDFTALRIQRVDENQGCAIFGAWKDEKRAKQVEQIFTSIKIKKMEKAEKR